MRSHRPGTAEYSLRGYGDMIADRVRMDAYHAALAARIRPGDVVLDLGAGTGIMSLLACKLGARRVHAIETSDAIAVGLELARANGFAGRIDFIQKGSQQVRLKKRASIMVSDLRGVLPLHGDHIPTIVDARHRLLAPGGVQIPERDTVLVQLVSDAALHDEELRIWRDGAYDLDLSPALRWAAHSWRKATLDPARLVGEARSIFELDYRTVTGPSLGGETLWSIEKDVTAHGIGAWFDTVLTGAIGFSNAPGRERAIYGQAFFPFTQPLNLRRGDTVSVALAASLVAGDYVWRWEASVTRAGARIAGARQSSFQAVPLHPGRLRSRKHRP